MNDTVIGIAGVGVFLPNRRMKAAEIAAATGGVWAEAAVVEKLGIVEKPIASRADGTQEMAVKAARAALVDGDIKAEDIDVILCMGEEWKEYPLTTSALYIQDAIGATRAWGIDLQNRCCTTVSALKIAKDMMIADCDIATVLIAGGYRNGDLVDYADPAMSMMYNLAAGGAAIILQRGLNKNKLLGSHIISDGSMSRDAGVEIGGICNPITADNIERAYKSLKLMRPVEMKARLNAVSMPNWLQCIDRSLQKSQLTRADIDYLAVLHFKRSMHHYLLDELGLTDRQSIYLEHYGHIGQIDQILSLQLALEQGRVKPGDNVVMVAAGIGYVWASCVINWG